MLDLRDLCLEDIEGLGQEDLTWKLLSLERSKSVCSPCLNLLVRKPVFCICENKDADQLRGNREADQRLCFRYMDSTILIKNFKPLAIFCDCTARFVSDLVGNPEHRFSHNEAPLLSSWRYWCSRRPVYLSTSIATGWLRILYGMVTESGINSSLFKGSPVQTTDHVRYTRSEFACGDGLSYS